MIYPMQIRAARALIAMSQFELAQQSNVGLATIKRIEAAGSIPTGNIKTLIRIREALKRAGVIFLDETGDSGPGVQLTMRLSKFPRQM